MIKRKKVLDYYTKTKGTISKKLSIKLVKDIYDSVGNCKRCRYWDGDGSCTLLNIKMEKKDYCSRFNPLPAPPVPKE